MAKEEFLNAALKTMKEEYGSINQFMMQGIKYFHAAKRGF